jgi:hypothetical protein
MGSFADSEPHRHSDLPLTLSQCAPTGKGLSQNEGENHLGLILFGRKPSRSLTGYWRGTPPRMPGL